jgi:hypothetical protein
MSTRFACQVSVGEIRAKYEEYLLKGVTGENGGLAKEISVYGEFNNKWAFTFCNRLPNLLSVKFNKKVLV